MFGENNLCVIHYAGVSPPLFSHLSHRVLGPPRGAATAPWGRCAHINKSSPGSSHLTRSLCPPSYSTITNTHEKSESRPNPSGSSALSVRHHRARTPPATTATLDQRPRSTVPTVPWSCLHPTDPQQFACVLCLRVLPWTASLTAARETHNRATANFILPIHGTDSIQIKPLLILSNTCARARRCTGSCRLHHFTGTSGIRAGDVSAGRVHTHTSALSFSSGRFFGTAVRVCLCARAAVQPARAGRSRRVWVHSTPEPSG